MRSGNDALGGIETGLITAGIAQLARFYNIPSRGPGGVTDSKCFDLQNGFERYQTLMLAAQAGINYVTCAGTYEATLLEALELLVLDDELAGIIRRGMEGIDINPESLAVEEIKKYAKIKRNYLGTKHSIKNTRKEIFVPELSNRDKRGIWVKKGSKDLISVARKKVEKILKARKGPSLPSNTEKELKNYFKKVSSRTLDDYRKLEGMDKSDRISDIAGVKIE